MGARAANAFTLIELLVVIAIIAILASLIFPVFSRAREKARQGRCSSNIRQIGMALLMYADDFDECMPPQFTGGPQPGLYRWMDEILPYVRNAQLFVCPTKAKAVYVPDTVGEYGGYVCNVAYFGRDNNDGQPTEPPFSIVGRALSEIEDESGTIMVGDGRTSNYQAAWNTRPNQPKVITDGHLHNYHGRHNDGLNALYCDGHVKWRALRALLKANSNGVYPHFTIQADDEW
ncbi:MAG: prepilin-type N-terminal cleavage/methylation domain-containing protein [Armatimonadota bacterium]